MPHRLPVFRAHLLRVACRLAVVCLLGGVAVPAWAGDKAAAESLFQDGKSAMDQGRYQQACGLFAASFDAEPSVGALLNLARCHQQRGKTASAWAVFNDAAAMAARAGQHKRESGAHRYAVKLEPLLSKITLMVESPPEGLEVTRNGQLVSAGSYGLALPVDPGDHEIVAMAPGYQRWATSVTVGANADRQTISIPALQPAAEVSPDDVAAGPTSGLLVGGLAVAGFGAAVLSVGIGFGVWSWVARNDLEDDCGGVKSCTGGWEDELASIRLTADISTAAFVIGSTALVGGAVMLLLSPSSPTDEDSGDATAAFTPWVGPGNAGLVVNGRF